MRLIYPRDSDSKDISNRLFAADLIKAGHKSYIYPMKGKSTRRKAGQAGFTRCPIRRVPFQVWVEFQFQSTVSLIDGIWTESTTR